MGCNINSTKDIFKYKPLLFCINDSPDITSQDVIKYKKDMELLFPNKSIAEK
jgi:hypothetical protein